MLVDQFNRRRFAFHRNRNEWANTMPKKKTSSTGSRFSVDATDPTRQRLERIIAAKAADNLGQAIKKAISVYEEICEAKKSGARILIDRNGEISELIIV
jgi:hypothetical protein